MEERNAFGVEDVIFKRRVSDGRWQRWLGPTGLPQRSQPVGRKDRHVQFLLFDPEPTGVTFDPSVRREPQITEPGEI